MLKDLLKEGGLYTFANLLTKGVSLLLIPFYTIYFSPADYGVLDILTIFTLFLTNILSLQLNQGLARYVGEPSISSLEKTKYASTAIWFSNSVLAFGTLIMFIFPKPFIAFLSNSTEIPITTFRFALITMFLNGVFYLFNTHLRFLRETKAFSLLSFSHAFFATLLILILVMKWNLGIDSIFIAYISVVPILILFQLKQLKGKILFLFDKKKLKDLLSFCVPLIPAAIAIIVMNFSDRIYIKKYMSFSELGIYGMAGKFSSIIVLVVSGFSMAITPLLLEQQYNKDTKNEMNRIFRLFIAFGTIGVLTLSLFSKEIIHLFTNYRFHSASDIVPIMFLSAFATGFAMFSQGLLLKKKSLISAIIVICFAGLNVGLNYILVPPYGLYGAATATLIAIVLHQITLFFISQKYFKFNSSFLKSGSIILLLVILVFGFMWWDPELNILNFVFKIIIILLFVAFIFLSKLIDMKSILRIIQRKNL